MPIAPAMQQCPHSLSRCCCPSWAFPPNHLGRSKQRPFFVRALIASRHYWSPARRVWKPVRFSGAGLRTSVPTQLPDLKEQVAKRPQI